MTKPLQSDGVFAINSLLLAAQSAPRASVAKIALEPCEHCGALEYRFTLRPREQPADTWAVYAVDHSPLRAVKSAIELYSRALKSEAPLELEMIEHRGETACYSGRASVISWLLDRAEFRIPLPPLMFAVPRDDAK